MNSPISSPRNSTNNIDINTSSDIVGSHLVRYASDWPSICLLFDILCNQAHTVAPCFCTNVADYCCPPICILLRLFVCHHWVAVFDVITFLKSPDHIYISTLYESKAEQVIWHQHHLTDWLDPHCQQSANRYTSICKHCDLQSDGQRIRKLLSSLERVFCWLPLNTLENMYPILVASYFASIALRNTG